MYGALAEERNVTITVDAEPGVFICSNREMLGQALSNLIDNALKYGGNRIELSAQREAGSLLIKVADNGPGIPEPLRATGHLPQHRRRRSRPFARRGNSASARWQIGAE